MSITTSARPVDLAHLAHYTGGDQALDAEILKLFVGQSEQLIAKLRIQLEKADLKGWHETNHSLKGAARGVGAFALADAAEAAERLNPAIDIRDAAHAIDDLRSQATAVKLFVEGWLKP
ncbi:MAG: Hpt domain-containing protein [Rhizomicrobium sp.]|jgi:HPt (histidine-containing phosphotransfer) domain-containing protein